jgi:glycerol-3-phosphate dehydrogenase
VDGLCAQHSTYTCVPHGYECVRQPGNHDPRGRRGFRTALVEREDFASQTSSRSTKLVHGGVRYLEKAVFQLSWPQLRLVYEALHERRRLLDNAPHLATALPILTACAMWGSVSTALGLQRAWLPCKPRV